MAKVHGYDLMALSGMVGRILPLFSLIVPFWLIWAFAGRKAMMEIWPAILVSGLSFAIPQFLVSNYIGPELVDVIAAISSMVCLDPVPAGLAAEDDLDLDLARPSRSQGRPACAGAPPAGLAPPAHAAAGGGRHAARACRCADHRSASRAARRRAAPDRPAAPQAKTFTQHPRDVVIRAWMPWVILSVFVFAWGLPPVKNALNGIFAPSFPIDGLHQLIEKMPPVVPEADEGRRGLHLQPALGDRHRHPAGGAHRRAAA